MRLREFWNDQSGAVTVDWVVLTAVAVVCCVAAVSVIKDPILNSLNRTVVYMHSWEDCQAGKTVIAALYGPPVRICN